MSWQQVELGELGSINTGSTPSTTKPEFWAESGTPFVTPGDLEAGSPITLAERYLTPQGKTVARVAPPGAVLVCCIGSLGKTGIAGTYLVTNQQINWIDFDKKLVDARYGYHSCARLAPQMINMAPSTTVAIVNKTSFSKLKIPLPPLDEQKRIAAILDKADALRAKRRQAIALLDSLTQSIFLEMFGDLTQWPTLKLAELTDEFRYGTSEKSQAVGYPTLRIPNVVGGSVSLSDLKFVPVNERELDRLRLQDGDILFVRTNGNKDYVGRSAVATTKIESGTGYVLSDFIYASYLIRARVKQDVVNPHFLQAFLSGAAGRKMLLERAKTSAGQYNINTEGLGSINIPIPPMGKQEAFQSTIEKLSESLNACRLNLGQVDVLVASLQHRAFTGQL